MFHNDIDVYISNKKFKKEGGMDDGKLWKFKFYGNYEGS